MATAVCPICRKLLFPNVTPGRQTIYKCFDHGTTDNDKIEWLSAAYDSDIVFLRGEAT